MSKFESIPFYIYGEAIGGPIRESFAGLYSSLGGKLKFSAQSASRKGVYLLYTPLNNFSNARALKTAIDGHNVIASK